MAPPSPLFLLQIVDHEGIVVRLPGGGDLERDLVQVCTRAIVKRGVGFFRSQARVEQAITDGIQEAIHALKTETLKVV